MSGIKFLLPCPLGAVEADMISYSYRKSGEWNRGDEGGNGKFAVFNVLDTICILFI